ncbi:tetratricopeptide repeat protein [Kutzneria sp. CA-103260]|uniref:tetratricopeptide repeat protein n=1 Tax=Kutzneria sp. CA-103260 TaxID=2802641 RepID=UPI001BA8498F|nr:tetratricopeptide repeat protein [Kutzneria sp. CA-103260]QUQ71622.1 tetratricopeptide repeat protein [Kutzneria sp. CA-103260]
MRALWTAIALTAALVVYFVLLADRAVLLIQAGGVVGVGLGVAVLALPLIGVWYVVVQWQNGIKINRLAKRLEAEGGLPDTSGLPRRPSGRVDRDAADEWFARQRVEVEQSPEDWRAWFRLAHAYDVAGDRGRAREAMRKAIELGG